MAFNVITITCLLLICISTAFSSYEIIKDTILMENSLGDTGKLTGKFTVAQCVMLCRVELPECQAISLTPYDHGIPSECWLFSKYGKTSPSKNVISARLHRSYTPNSYEVFEKTMIKIKFGEGYTHTQAIDMDDCVGHCLDNPDCQAAMYNTAKRQDYDQGCFLFTSTEKQKCDTCTLATVQRHHQIKSTKDKYDDVVLSSNDLYPCHNESSWVMCGLACEKVKRCNYATYDQGCCHLKVLLYGVPPVHHLHNCIHHCFNTALCEAVTYITKGDAITCTLLKVVSGSGPCDAKHCVKVTVNRNFARVYVTSLGTSYPGDDLASISDVSDIELCAAHCVDNNRCKAASLWKNMKTCHLKASNAGAKANDAFTSATMVYLTNSYYEILYDIEIDGGANDITVVHLSNPNDMDECVGRLKQLNKAGWLYKLN